MKKIGHSPWLMITLYFFLLVSVIDQSSASNYELREELRFIHQEIGLLRDENHHQNMEIALLKEEIGNTKDSDDQKMITANLDDNQRNKRPVRLLPPHLLFGERKNETEQRKQMNRRRYEQPTNCSDLSILGYTLNGFYTVKSNESSTKSNRTNNHIKLETVFCAFKQPEGTFNPALLEKRIISRRETKPSTGKVLYLHATRNTDLEAKVMRAYRLSFDKVIVNLGNAFDVAEATFTFPKSGVYLFIFRGNITFAQGNVNRQFYIYYFKDNKNKVGQVTAEDITNRDESRVSFIVELDKLVKGNRGDTIMIGAYFLEFGGVKFSANSTSFTGYLLEE